MSTLMLDLAGKTFQGINDLAFRVRSEPTRVCDLTRAPYKCMNVRLGWKDFPENKRTSFSSKIGAYQGV
jgi:hypothetical protein